MSASSTPGFVNHYNPGDLFRSVATFVSTDYITPADPSTIDLYIIDAHGGAATYRYGIAGASVLRLATGIYARDNSIPFLASAVGEWEYGWVGSGGIQAHQPWKLIVDRNRAFIL